ILQAGNLGDAALGREVAPEDGEMSLAIHRLREGPDHFLICAWLRRHVLQHLADRSSMDGHAIAVQEVVLKQDLQYLRHTAGTVEVDRDEAPGGLEVAEDGH